MGKKIGVGLLVAVLIVAIVFFLKKSSSPEPALEKRVAAKTVREKDVRGRELQVEPAKEKESVQAENQESTRPEKTAIPESARVYGKVVLVDGRPVAGARVRLGVRDDDLFPTRWCELEQITGEDGAFSFEDLAVGRYRLLAEKGYLLSYQVREEVYWITIEEETRVAGPLNLEMRPAQSLEIRTVSASGQQPVEGAIVTVLDDKHRDYPADEKGRVRIALTPEIWNLEIKAPFYEKAHRSIMISPGKDQELVIPLKPAGLIYGIVTDLDGVPVPDAFVSSAAIAGQPTRTDEAGKYRIEHVPLRDPLEFSVSKSGFEHQRVDAPVLSETKIRVEVNVQLNPKPEGESGRHTLITGTVSDSDQQPISGAHVHVGQLNRPTYRETFTDATGTFRLEAKDLDDYWSAVVAEAGGYAPQHQNLSLSTNKREETIKLEFVLLKGMWVKGQVLDEAGDPIEDAKLAPLAFKMSQPLFGGNPVATDPAGWFEIDSLPLDVVFTISARGFSTLKFHTLELNRGDHEIVLPGHGLLKGKVIDEETGQPVRQFNVRLGRVQRSRSPSLGRFWERRGVDFTAEDGAFHIADLNAGDSVNMIVTAEDYVEKILGNIRIEPDARSEPMIVKLSKTGLSVRGFVQNEQARTLPDIEVRLLVSSQERLRRYGYGGPQIDITRTVQNRAITTSHDGSFSFEGIPENRPFDLVLTGDRIAKTIVDSLEDKTPEERENLIVTAKPGGRIVCRVNRERHKGQVSVNLNGNSESENLNLKPNQETVTFDRIAPGTYYLGMFASEPGATAHETTDVTVESGKTVEVDFGFEERYRVSGLVSLNEKPMADALIILSEKDIFSSSAPQTRTDERGFFEFEEVKDGEYEVVAIEKAALTPNERFMLMRSHPNREVFTVRGDDYTGRFRFFRFGNLQGQIEPLPSTPWSMVLFGTAGTKREHRFWEKDLSAEGAFHFDSVPPGIYTLFYSENNKVDSLSRRLLADIHMPDDGSDVDLGVIEPRENEPGQLRILIEGDLPQVPLGFMLMSPGSDLSDFTQSLISGQYVPRDGTILVEEVPSGSYQCRLVFYQGGYRPIPETVLTEVFPGETSEILFTSEKITELAFFYSGESVFRDVYMIHENGTRLDFTLDQVDQPFALYQSGEIVALYGPKWLRARNIPPGKWKLVVENESGATVERELELVPGKPISERLAF